MDNFEEKFSKKKTLMPKLVEKPNNFYSNFIYGYYFQMFQFKKARTYTFPLEYTILKVFSKLALKNCSQKDIIMSVFRIDDYMNREGENTQLTKDVLATS